MERDTCLMKNCLQKSVSDFFKSYLIVSDPIDFSTPAPLSFTISQSLLKFMSIESVALFKHPVLCRPLLLLPSIFPSIRSFLMYWLFALGGQSIRASALASVLPMNVQGLFPFRLIGLISLQSRGLSRVFSSTTI